MNKMVRPTRNLRYLLAGVGLVATSIVAPGAVPQAKAALPGCGALGNQHVGYERNGYRGTSARIVVRNPALCLSEARPDFNFSNAWSMVASAPTDPTRGYAQVGYMRQRDGVVRDFWEYDPDGTGPIGRTRLHTTLTPRADGEEHQYWVKYETLNACNCLQLIVDGTVYVNTPFNPFTTFTQPFANQWFGETTFCESDVPGRPGTTARFSQLQIQADNNQFASSLPSLNQGITTCARHSRNTPATQAGLGTVFDIWTP